MSVADFYSRTKIISNEWEIFWLKPKFCLDVTLSIKKHLKEKKRSLQRDCGTVVNICRTSVIILLVTKLWLNLNTA